MEAKAAGNEQFPLKVLMNLELLVASLLPASAILLIGVVGSRFIVPAFAGNFLFFFLLTALIVFFAEFALLATMQRAIKAHFSNLIAVCQAYLAGNKERRAALHGDQDLTTLLAKALNALLDSVARPVAQVPPQQAPQPVPYPMGQQIPQPAPYPMGQQAPQQVPQSVPQPISFAAPKPTAQPVTQKRPVVQDETPLKRQLKQLVEEINPVMDADLSVKATVAAGDVGIVADICNYLVEELVQNVQWVRFASEQIITATHNMLDHSIELAQTFENQIGQLSQVTETVETLVTFIQRLSNTLQLSADIAHEDYEHVKEQMNGTNSQLAHMLNNTQAHAALEQDTQRQIELLDQALEGTQEHTALAESIIGDLYTFAQRMHQSSTGVLNTAERIGALIALAEQWRNSVSAFELPGADYDQDAPLEEEDEGSIVFSIPTPTSPLKGARRQEWTR
ncbi:MAG TPA: hypothetical protein VKR06_40530 [Ktedonosporobacter sp.]|nr:hypothetical protein [Ktedonosporobacter sp.]